jgi:hypothetical protein
MLSQLPLSTLSARLFSGRIGGQRFDLDMDECFRASPRGSCRQPPRSASQPAQRNRLGLRFRLPSGALRIGPRSRDARNSVRCPGSRERWGAAASYFWVGFARAPRLPWLSLFGPGRRDKTHPSSVRLGGRVSAISWGEGARLVAGQIRGRRPLSSVRPSVPPEAAPNDRRCGEALSGLFALWRRVRVGLRRLGGG